MLKKIALALLQRSFLHYYKWIKICVKISWLGLPKNYLMFNFEKLVKLLSQGSDQLPFLQVCQRRQTNGNTFVLDLLQALSIDYVSISFILIWVKINVWQKAKHWNRSINMPSPLGWIKVVKPQNQRQDPWEAATYKTEQIALSTWNNMGSLTMDWGKVTSRTQDKDLREKSSTVGSQV